MPLPLWQGILLMSSPMCLTLARLRATRSLLGRYISNTKLVLLIVHWQTATFSIHWQWLLCDSFNIQMHHWKINQIGSAVTVVAINIIIINDHQDISRLAEKGAWEEVLQLLEERQARPSYKMLSSILSEIVTPITKADRHVISLQIC